MPKKRVKGFFLRTLYPRLATKKRLRETWVIIVSNYWMRLSSIRTIMQPRKVFSLICIIFHIMRKLNLLIILLFVQIISNLNKQACLDDLHICSCPVFIFLGSLLCLVYSCRHSSNNNN